MFKLNSEFKPTGDQPQAINLLVNNIKKGDKAQILKGATGTGKTFTMANVIQEVNEPTLVISHNKTLAAQLYDELKRFFPDNKVEYFISYFDFYRPENYNPVMDRYLMKESMINEEIKKFRLSTLSSLLSKRKDVIVVASVSCVYGAGNPQNFRDKTIEINVNQNLSQRTFLLNLINALYKRVRYDNFTTDSKPGEFDVIGDTIMIKLPFNDDIYRVTFFGDTIEEIHNTTNKVDEDSLILYPTEIFLPADQTKDDIYDLILQEANDTHDYFMKSGQEVEAKRILERTTNDVELMREIGYCTGRENYTPYFGNTLNINTTPFCLLNYFPDEFLTIIDESHVTIPQIKSIHKGYLKIKQNLVEYGWRLPSTMQARPLKFDEFEMAYDKIVYVSATPADYEFTQTEGEFIEQVIRPTFILDPLITIMDSEFLMDKVTNELQIELAENGQIIINTLSKKESENLHSYLNKIGYNTIYLHSEIKPLDRIKIINKFKNREIDILIGINLLREGLDLPNVTLIMIIDADKEGFLRSYTTLTQLSGRAARNVNGRVIFFADKETKSINNTIKESLKRRAIQEKYNIDNSVTPKNIIQVKPQVLEEEKENELIPIHTSAYYKDLMKKASRAKDYIQAAYYRDLMFAAEK